MMSLSKVKKVQEIITLLGGEIASDDEINWGVKLTIVDKNGYRYFTETDIILSSETLGSRFGKSNPYTIENIKRYLGFQGWGDVSLLSKSYISEKSLLLFRCRCGNQFQKDWSHVKSGGYLQCNKCSNKSKRKVKYDYVYKIFYDNGLTLLDENVSDDSYYNCITKDGYKCYCYLWNIKKGVMADPFRENNPYCYENFSRYVSINTKATFISADTRRIFVRCECGNDFVISRHRFWDSSLRCQECKKRISKNELAVKQFLDDIGIEYKQQYRFTDCKNKKPLPFDFYIGSKNLCIEVQGEQHYYEIPIWTNRGGLNGTQKRDKIKKDYCLQKGISLLEISYIEIKNNSYKDKLSKILKQQ